MTFSSAIFLFSFLPITMILYSIPLPLRWKNGVLTAASLLFYAFGEPIYVFLMLASSFVNYLFGRLLEHEDRAKGKKGLMALAVCFNVAILGVFKYAGFAVGSLNQIAGTAFPVPEIALPIGVSFFTFQALSYVIDVYRNPKVAEKDFGKVLLYISFFPQLIAGPIVRWEDLAEQLKHRKQDEDLLIQGLQRFVVGLFKKMAFANGLGCIADRVFALDMSDYAFWVAWLGAICYTLQIYYDFSGYSDMAIGLAGMFGFRLKENFAHPYAATSIQEFWKKWHMSLTSWFREYVYIPLGGNRKGKLRTECNKMLVFALTGIWHGANWTFIVWGLFHGLLSILEDSAFSMKRIKNKVIGNLYTWILVMLGFVMFRADTVAYGLQMIAAMFTNFHANPQSVSFFMEQMNAYAMTLLGLAILFSYPISNKLKAWSQGFATRHPKLWTGWRYAEILALLFVCMLQLASAAYNPFIYFRF